MLLDGEGPFAALYNVVEGDFDRELVLSYFRHVGRGLVIEQIDLNNVMLSLYRGNEFAILRVFESQKSPFTTKIAG